MVDLAKIKEKAKGKNLSIAQLEIKAGIANGTISGWEKSKPFVETLSKVANVLECSIEELLVKE